MNELSKISEEKAELEEYRSPFEEGLAPEIVLFCHQYAIDLNPQQAAARCGIELRTANRYLRMPEVKKCVVDIHAKVLKICNLTEAEVVNELWRIASYDIKGIVKNINDSGVEFVPFEEMDGRAIAEVKQAHTKDGLTYAMVKPHRKIDALKALLERFKNAPPEQHLHIHTDDVKAMDPEKAMDRFNDLLGRT